MTKELFDLGALLIEMSIYSRKHGLLALKDFVVTGGNTFLLEFLPYVYGGYDSNKLRIILNNKIFMGYFHKWDIAKCNLIMEVLISILNGDHIIYITSLVCSCFNDKQKKEFTVKYANYFRTRDEFFQGVKEKLPLSSNTTLLEHFLEYPEDSSDFSRELCNMDSQTLSTALYGASGKVTIWFMKLIPIDEIIERIIWNFDFLYYLNEKEIIESQKYVLNRMGMLSDFEDILVLEVLNLKPLLDQLDEVILIKATMGASPMVNEYLQELIPEIDFKKEQMKVGRIQLSEIEEAQNDVLKAINNRPTNTI